MAPNAAPRYGPVGWRPQPIPFCVCELPSVSCSREIADNFCRPIHRPPADFLLLRGEKVPMVLFLFWWLVNLAGKVEEGRKSGTCLESPEMIRKSGNASSSPCHTGLKSKWENNQSSIGRKCFVSVLILPPFIGFLPNKSASVHGNNEQLTGQVRTLRACDPFLRGEGARWTSSRPPWFPNQTSNQKERPSHPVDIGSLFAPINHTHC